MDHLKSIFAYQAQFLEPALKREAANGFNHGLTSPLVQDFNCSKEQDRMKSAAWRVVEEISETQSAFQEQRFDEAEEEAIDVLCFSTNIVLMSGIKEYAFGMPPMGKIQTTFLNYSQAVHYLGLAMNELKNRAWRSTLTPTDMLRYRELVCDFYQCIVNATHGMFDTPDELLAAYLKKKGINEERAVNGY